MKTLPLVIPAAGEGSRLRPHTSDIPKVMVSFGGKTIIDYVLDLASHLQINQIYVIVGYKRRKLEEYINRNYGFVEFVYQKKRRGLVDAISKMEGTVKDFIMMLGDEVYIDTSNSHRKLIPFYFDNKPDGICCVFNPKNKQMVHKNYSIRLNKSGEIIEAEEKPDKVDLKRDLVGTGTCIFNKKVFDFIDKTPINPKRNVKELADLIQVMINSGKIFLPYFLQGSYVNINSPEDLSLVEKMFRGL